MSYAHGNDNGDVSVARVDVDGDSQGGFAKGTLSGDSAPSSAKLSVASRVGSVASGVSRGMRSVLFAHKVGATMAAVAIAACGVAGTVAVVSGSHGDAVDQTVLWVDDEECVDHIQEAKEELGYGESKIDETWNGHGVGIYATREFDLCHPRVGYHGLTSPYCFPTGTSQAVVQDLWVSSGAKHDEAGFCKIGDCYLIACTSVFGEVGDKITFYFDDGSHIDTIKTDAKAESEAWFDHDPATKWGHDDGRCVLEFCGEDRIGDEPYSTLGKVGRHTVSWTNHGKAADIGGSLGGSAGAASGAASAAGRGRAASAFADCETKPDYDNSTLAAALVSYSYSQREVYDGSQWEGTKLYLQVWEGVYPGDGYPRSCDRSVASAIKWTGADDSFPAGACAQQLVYCHDHGNTWEHIGDFQASAGGATAAKEAKSWGLQPGDILICDDHTMAYVGEEAVADGYGQVIKGTDGDVGVPDASDAFVSGSISGSGDSGSGSRAPAIGAGWDFAAHTYAVFRYKGDYPDADKHDDLGSMASLSGKSSAGTACECAEPEPPMTCGERIADLAASLALSAPNDGKDYGKMLSDLGLSDRYATTAGNRIVNRFHEGQTPGAAGGDWGSFTANGFGEVPSLKIPKAEAYIDFTMDDPSAPGYASFANCSAMPWHCQYRMGYPAWEAVNLFNRARLPENGGEGVPAADLVCQTEAYEYILADPDKTWEEQCKPGDLLGNGTVPHYMMYVGNEMAQRYFPGTTGYMCEAGARSRTFWCVTDCKYDPTENWLIARPKCSYGAEEREPEVTGWADAHASEIG